MAWGRNIMGSVTSFFSLKRTTPDIETKTSSDLSNSNLTNSKIIISNNNNNNNNNNNLSGHCCEPIHVYSLASGHMYERLLRIMVLSVRKNTNCPLVFWFIDNFLSPKFKQIMPLMAERYNLQYHFVRYKWPSWLRKQTEKQRQIWAYKILFLDVMFPGNLNRILYIDADQVDSTAILLSPNLLSQAYAHLPQYGRGEAFPAAGRQAEQRGRSLINNWVSCFRSARFYSSVPFVAIRSFELTWLNCGRLT